jgi:hypothetical protein
MVLTIPKQIWYIQSDDGLQHLLEISFKSRMKNVELKLDEDILFDLKLKEYETVYPLRVGSDQFTLYLRKKPVGVYEVELKDAECNKVPYYTDLPRNFGKPRKQWNKIVPLVGFLIILAFTLLQLIILYVIY